MKKSEVKLKSADEVNYLASSYICGADELILCCFYCRVALVITLKYLLLKASLRGLGR